MAIALLMAATFASVACLAIVIGVAIVGGKGVPASALWGCLVVFTLFSLATSWMLVRLLRNARARNGKTTMPEWFIQAFGVLMLAAIGLVAVTQRNPLFFCEACGVALAMVGIRSLLRAPSKDGSES
jgi:hypothetical protein